MNNTQYVGPLVMISTNLMTELEEFVEELQSIHFKFSVICFYTDQSTLLGNSSIDQVDLTRFNKIAIPNNKFQMASGQ